MIKRVDGRTNDELRPVRIELGYLAFAEGSALIELGNTRILCAVTVEDKVPVFLKEGEKYYIPKFTWHRVIKGTGDLRILLEKVY